jgi:DNA repair protein RecN (Recombination protein N)
VLTEIRVRDLAVIADASLHLEPGLNVLTGETGAGKSMLVDALALLLGERATGDRVRPGADRAVVEAAFEPAGGAAATALAAVARESGIELDDGRLVVRRELRAEGPNRAWANGSPTTVATLADLGRLLVDLHGQHEAQSLLRPPAQRDLLDAFAGAEREREAVAAAFAEARAAEAAEATLVAQHAEIERRADYLRHVAQEIRAAALKLGEDEALAVEAKRLAAGEELTRLAGALAELLDDEEQGAVARLGAADRVMTQLARLDPTIGGWRELLDGAQAQAGELARAIRAYAAGLDLDPARLEQVERRRDLLFRLIQKYGPTIEDVLHTGSEASRELDMLDTAALDLAGLRERRSAADRKLAAAAAALTTRRRQAAARLEKAVTKLLPGLGLPGGKVRVEVAPGPVSSQGGDAVTFQVELNVGMDPRPLAQVASGGELSRITLAFKAVLAAHDAVPTLVFDEVDQGIGGEVGQQVAEALARVAAKRQVLVVTHLAQIAARADHHLKIVKRVVRGMSTAGVEVLRGQARELEVARMLGDPEDGALRAHAAELLRRRRASAGA